MTGGDGTPQKADDLARRRRLREQVFGDVLPETTGDEREPGAGERSDSNDESLRHNVPPHHGG